LFESIKDCEGHFKKKAQALQPRTIFIDQNEKSIGNVELER